MTLSHLLRQARTLFAYADSVSAYPAFVDRRATSSRSSVKPMHPILLESIELPYTTCWGSAGSLVRRAPLFENSSDHRQWSQRPFNFWTKTGGVLLAAYLLNKAYEPAQRVFAAESNQDRTSLDGNRAFVPYDMLRKNEFVNQEKLSEWEAIGFIPDPETRADGRIFYRLKGEHYREQKDGYVKGNNRFYAEVINNQLIWHSSGEIDGLDVNGIAAFYKMIKRSLVINSGIHRKSDGTVVVDYNSGGFPIRDIHCFGSDGLEVYLQTICSISDPILQDRYKTGDILCAYCYSDLPWDPSKPFEVSRGVGDGVSIKEVLESFEVQRVGYPGKVISDTKYVEMGSLKEDVSGVLKVHSFCYIEGVGGLGKSRIALEIEEAIRNSIASGNNQDYFETVFFSLKSESDISNFLEHVKKKVGPAVSTEARLRKYFDLLGYVAQAMEKKVFVVIDNIDTAEDFHIFTTIFESLQKFKNSDGKSPFTLLVTGRTDVSRFLEDRGVSSQNTIIGIEEYCKNNIWNLFVEIFKDECKPAKRANGVKLLEADKEHFSKLLASYGNHTGFTIVVAKILAQAYESGMYLEYRGSITQIFNSIIKGGDFLKDYQLADMVQMPLKLMEKDFGPEAGKIYEVIALMSDGYVVDVFFKSVLKDCFNTDPVKFLKIITRLRKYGLIRYDDSKRSYIMPNFYNALMRNEISQQYGAKKDYIDLAIKKILENIAKNLQHKIHENMMYLFSLFNCAKAIPDANLMYEKISEMAAQYALRYLHVINYSDLIERYNHFFSEISKRPGYSIDPVLCKYMKSEEVSSVTGDLIDKIDRQLQREKNNQKDDEGEFSAEFTELLKSLNNLYVFIKIVNKNTNKLIEIENKLNEMCSYNKLNDGIKKFIQSNMKIDKKNEDLQIFSQISFHKVAEDQRKKAEQWKDDFKKQGDDNKKANLSGKGIDGGLRVLIHYLMEKVKVERVDLSHNYLGRRNTKAVSDLLKYPGSLKVLHLNNNSFYVNDYGHFEKIIDGLANNTTLEKLYLNNNSLTNDHIFKLCDALRKHPKITYIDVQSNKFDEKGVDALIQLFHDNPKIQLIMTESAHWYNPYHKTAHLHRSNCPICNPNVIC